MKLKRFAIALMTACVLTGCSTETDTVEKETKVVEEVKTPVVVDERMSFEEYMAYFNDGIRKIRERENSITETFLDIKDQSDVSGDEFIDEIEKQYLAMKPIYDDFIAKSDDVPEGAEQLHKETVEMTRLLITGGEYLVSELRGEEVNADYEYNSALYKEKLVEVNALLDEYINSHKN